DAAGVAELAEAAARRGADAMALSPVHALFTAEPSRFGPYAPSSRLFLNPLHAAPSLVFDASMMRQAMADSGVQPALAAQEGQSLIDWPAAAEAKLTLLRALFDLFVDGPELDGPLGADFARFQAAGGPLLTEHTCFEALHAEQMPANDWRAWPVDPRNPSSAAVAAFAHARRREVMFHAFLQWVADRSLSIAQDRAREAGMRIGLIGDMAVGMSPAGSHAWSRQGDVLLGLTIGAPPDLLNPRGQNWGLTSFSPRALSDGGYAPFIATMRAVMRNVGGIRVDHAMGLARLWLVPEGASPADGAYLTYPVTDLLRLLALESARHGAVVIGEDLGTVPPGFHAQLEQAGVHGMRVLWFERGEHGFAPPAEWQRTAVAMTSTHDLPTVASWWTGRDIAIRDEHHRLGEGVTADSVTAERNHDRPLLWNALVEAGVASGPPPAPDAPDGVVDAALEFVARTESPLCLLPLEDVRGDPEQPNLPGTVDEYPNWRRRLETDVTSLFDEPTLARRVEAIATIRPRQ
ncbi:MAG: 4-alpha-glucanotransferase, partial [Rhodospirillales bacterium]|nr:4-alpha-glucanotransferase [Rhodospirillales bacterium]